MNRSTANSFFKDVKRALNDSFDECFWSIQTEVLNHEATIYITLDYYPDYIDDVYCAVEDALDDNVHWDFGYDWSDNTLGVCIED